MQRFLLACFGVLFLGSTGAFFLFVPLLSIMTAAWLLVGLMLMFGLGFQLGTQRIPASETIGTVQGDREFRQEPDDSADGLIAKGELISTSQT